MIYTKKGDKGKTSLIDKKRVSKSNKIIWVIGEIDELNSYLGVIRAEVRNKDLNKKLKIIQEDLFCINSILAGAKIQFEKNRVKLLEREIDKIESILPVQTKFIFPSGTKVASVLFFARSIARRVERKLVGLKKREVLGEVLMYLNRLSDYLFILARFENFKYKVKEDYWRV